MTERTAEALAEAMTATEIATEIERRRAEGANRHDPELVTLNRAYQLTRRLW